MHEMDKYMIEVYNRLSGRYGREGIVFKPIFYTTNIGKSRFQYHFKTALRQPTPPPLPEGTDYNDLLSEEYVASLG
jgi:hypothetical protein